MKRYELQYWDTFTEKYMRSHNTDKFDAPSEMKRHIKIHTKNFPNTLYRIVQLTESVVYPKPKRGRNER